MEKSKPECFTGIPHSPVMKPVLRLNLSLVKCLEHFLCGIDAHIIFSKSYYYCLFFIYVSQSWSVPSVFMHVTWCPIVLCCTGSPFWLVDSVNMSSSTERWRGAWKHTENLHYFLITPGLSSPTCSQTHVHNRGPQFTSWVWKAFMENLGVAVSLTSGYHPQSNGHFERLNQEIGCYIRSFCSSDLEC